MPNHCRNIVEKDVNPFFKFMNNFREKKKIEEKNNDKKV
jgi:hypothetical protein